VYVQHGWSYGQWGDSPGSYSGTLPQIGNLLNILRSGEFSVLNPPDPKVFGHGSGSGSLFLKVIKQSMYR
jgi:hypothetical protein